MENYWSELVWQNGGDIISADHKTSLVASDQAAGGIQFLQDLIWKDKVMPDARSPTRSATPSSRARPRWSPTARGSSRPTGRRHRLRDRAAAEGPGRPGHLDQPDRRRGLQGHEEPGRRLGVRQVPREPGRADQAHGAQGVAAGQQGGPQRTVRDVVRRRQGPRRRDRLRPHQAVVQGLQRLDDRPPDGDRRERLHRAEEDRQAGPDRRPAGARQDPRQQ